MQSFLAKLIILFILFANLAWAVDMDEVGPPGETAGEPSIMNMTDDRGDGAGHDDAQAGKMVFCDHCCHGSVHYLGLPVSLSGVHTTSFFARPVSLGLGYRSRDLEPPLPPPNI